MVDISMEEVPALLPRLLAMPKREIDSRQAYLRHVAHWLHYDRPEYAGRDAAAALVRHIERRVQPWLARRRRGYDGVHGGGSGGSNGL